MKTEQESAQPMIDLLATGMNFALVIGDVRSISNEVKRLVAQLDPRMLNVDAFARSLYADALKRIDAALARVAFKVG